LIRVKAFGLIDGEEDVPKNNVVEEFIILHLL
jgi:hypothetical protein